MKEKNSKKLLTKPKTYPSGHLPPLLLIADPPKYNGKEMKRIIPDRLEENLKKDSSKNSKIT
jgi:hypothetical protein